MVGALCYAELVTAYPNTGGEYHFLTRAYGPNVGFMFAWARMTVVQTGSIALLAYIFGDYASQLLPLGTYGPTVYAIAAVIAITLLNIVGIQETRRVQNVLATATILGLVCVIGAGLIHMVGATQSEAAPAAAASPLSSAVIGSSLIFVLLTYGGWNEAAYVSAEVRGGPRNMVRALLLSIGLITLLYVAVNLVYVQVLGVDGVAKSEAVASDVMRAVLGPPGAVLIAGLIVIKTLASVNVTIFTGARTNYALGRDFPLFSFLAHWSASGGAPVRALVFQAAIALALILLGAANRQGIQTVVDYLSPVFWFFFLLVGISLFLFRRREPDHPRRFKVPLYPLTPAVFCLTCAYLLYSSLSYTGFGALAGVGVLALGVPVLVFARRRSTARDALRPTP
jgi:amino acid transporter